MSTKTKSYTQYKRKDGTIVPSVNSILNVMSKPALLDWAWQSRPEGSDYREVEGNAGDINILAHYLIMCHLKEQMPNTSGYAPVAVEKATNCLMQYQRWEREHPMTLAMIETPLVSEEFNFGGTPDLVAELDDGFSLVAFEIGQAACRDMFYRLAAYWKLTMEHGWPIASARVLRIGTNDAEGFEETIKTSPDTEWQIFTHCLVIYRLQQQEDKEAG